MLRHIRNNIGSAMISMLTGTIVIGLISVATMQMIKNAKRAENYISKITDFSNFNYTLRLVLENQRNCLDMAENLEFDREPTEKSTDPQVKTIRFGIGSPTPKVLATKGEYLYDKVMLKEMRIEKFEGLDDGYKTYKADLFYEATDEARNDQLLTGKITLKIGAVLRNSVEEGTENGNLDVKKMKIVSCAAASSADGSNIGPTCPSGKTLNYTPMGPSCDESASNDSTPTSTTVPAAPAGCSDPYAATTSGDDKISWSFPYSNNSNMQNTIDGKNGYSLQNPYTGNNACASKKASCTKVYDKNGIERPCALNLSSYNGSSCNSNYGCGGIALCKKYTDTVTHISWSFPYSNNSNMQNTIDGQNGYSLQNPYTGNSACASRTATCFKVYDKNGTERACDLNLSAYNGSTCNSPYECGGIALCRRHTNAVAKISWSFPYSNNSNMQNTIDGQNGYSLENPYTGNNACASKTSTCFKVFDKNGVERACDLNLSTYNGSSCNSPYECSGIALCANCSGGSGPSEKGASWSNTDLTGNGACYGIGGTCKSASGMSSNGYAAGGCDQLMVNGGALCKMDNGKIGSPWTNKDMTGNGACYGVGGTCASASGASSNGYAAGGCDQLLRNGGALCNPVSGNEGVSWTNKNLTGNGACYGIGRTCKSASGVGSNGYAAGGCDQLLRNGGALCQ